MKRVKRYKIDQLKRLIGYLDNFQKDYEKVIHLCKNIENINSLGSMMEYPFHKSLDNIHTKKWINKFKKNIENEIEKIENLDDSFFD